MDSAAYDTLVSTDQLQSDGFRQRSAPVAVLAMDPAGDGKDRTALTLTEREAWVRGEPYDPDVRLIYRLVWRIGTLFPVNAEFPFVNASVYSAMNRLRTAVSVGNLSEAVLAVECNGVGWGYASDLRTKLPKGSVMPITTTGGNYDHAMERRGYTMPRKPAADNFRVLMETGRWITAPEAPMADALKSEMDSFIWRNGKPQAAEGQHDDLVMSSIIGSWVASKLIPADVQFKVEPERGGSTVRLGGRAAR